MELKIKQAVEVERGEDWDPRCNQAAREFLDHLARELAEEYIRLTKEAALNQEGKDQ